MGELIPMACPPPPGENGGMPHKLRLHSLIWVLVDYSLKSQMIIFCGGDSVLKSISFNVEKSSAVISLINK